MIGTIVKVIFGLFVWMVLPVLIFNKKKKSKKPIILFTSISCKIIGIAIVVISIFSFLKTNL